jgi:ferredoxin, 2Fe-2S
MNSGNNNARKACVPPTPSQPFLNRSIEFTVVLGSERSHVTTYRGEYRNLMVLVYDKFYPDGFGECKGMGRCGTCHIQVSGNSPGLLTRISNENAALAKTSCATKRSRLACQILVDDELDGEVVEVISDDERN